MSSRCRSCWHAVKKVKGRSRTDLKWCSASQRKLMMPCTCLCWMVGTHTHVHWCTLTQLSVFLWKLTIFAATSWRANLQKHLAHLLLFASHGFTFRFLLSRRQDLMETLTPRENWYCRSPSRSGIPRLWSGRDATGISSSSRCLWSLARRSKTQTDAASTCTRASSL